MKNTEDARQTFMDEVYAELESDPDNNRANHIINAGDAYAETYAETLQKEQTPGEWVPVGAVDVLGGESALWRTNIAYHKCSKCHNQALCDENGNEVLTDFCPFCGKKLKH